jgi:signal transduction histidine kinase
MSADEERREGQMGSLFDAGISPIIAAAHELKSPLALVRQLALSLEQGDLAADDQQRLLRQITLTSERALRLTSDLTRTARLQDAMFELEPINPVALCEDIVHELTPLFAAHDRVIRVRTRKHPLLLIANRDLLRRIIMNFSDNALHYSEGDRVVEIQIKALSGGKTIRLGVRDYGPAVSSDMWRTLQKKLSTSPQVVHARPQSSGLGLYIASQFAEAMQGQIGMTRHRDGATFYVDLFASRQMSLL